MPEYIERDALVKNLNCFAPEHYTELINDLIMKQPAVDVEPVRYGHWILEREPDGKPYCFHCSACDDDFANISNKKVSDYCPNCGAKMEGGMKNEGDNH